MKNKVIEKVNECLEKWRGGEIFFNEIDRMMKFDKEILMNFINQIDCKANKTIASGEFGLCLHNYNIPVDIIVQGGLRNRDNILDLSSFVIPGEKYLFLDDSYFSGRTTDIVRKEVERCGGIFVGCHVIYDGSDDPKHEVKSVYRYHDYH